MFIRLSFNNYWSTFLVIWADEDITDYKMTTNYKIKLIINNLGLK
jgi:hypothetical protein